LFEEEIRRRAPSSLPRSDNASQPVFLEADLLSWLIARGPFDLSASAPVYPITCSGGLSIQLQTGSSQLLERPVGRKRRDSAKSLARSNQQGQSRRCCPARKRIRECFQLPKRTEFGKRRKTHRFATIASESISETCNTTISLWNI